MGREKSEKKTNEGEGQKGQSKSVKRGSSYCLRKKRIEK
jgi:hypothetical protein